MNKFLQITFNAIKRNSIPVQYIQVQIGEYDTSTATIANTEITHDIQVYKKHIVANEYNFPNLIGKEVANFYIVNKDITFTPKTRDIIRQSGKEYSIESVTEFAANGDVVLYVITGALG